MSDNPQDKEMRYASIPSDLSSNGEVGQVPAEKSSHRVRSRVLLSSTMLSDRELMRTAPLEQPRNVTNSSTATANDPQHEVVKLDGLSNESTASTSVPESASEVIPEQQTRNDDQSALIKKTEMNKIMESVTPSLPSFGVIKDVAKIKHLRQAAQIVADFIPVVGNSGTSLHASGVRRSRKPIDTVNADELANSPLHKACALSGSMSLLATTSSARSQTGGDLAYIKQLVEEDPTQLHAQLPTSGDTPLHIAIKFGAMQWLQMQEYPGGITNLAVVEYLIKADIDHLRKEAVRERKKAGNSSPISLGSLIFKSALYIQNCGEELPLHSAVVQGYEGAARALLGVDKDADYDSILVKNEEENLSLHLAVLADDLSLVRLLLNADTKREEMRHRQRPNTSSGTTGQRPTETKSLPTLITPNADKNIPLHLALSSAHRFEMWGLLLDADETKETLHAQNQEGITPFRFFVDQPHICKNENKFVDTHLAEAILDRLLSGKRLEPWDDHLKRSVAKSQRMQVAMNEAAANRLPVVMFMSDFYSHIASMVILFTGTDIYLETEGKKEVFWMAEALYAIIAYFIMRECIQLFLTRSLYWSDFWNYMDIMRIILLILLALIVSGDYIKHYDQDETDHYVVRRLLLALGVFIYMGFTSFLRMTYLPFALFVGGTTQIVMALIPFMVTFVLVLGLFAYGYWVGGFVSLYTEGLQSYGEWLLEIFLSAVNGPESLAVMDDAYINKYVWTVLFMVLVQILLLNVLIAVITSAWENITEKQTQVFWKYRLEYASGVLPIEHFLGKYFGNTYLYLSFAKAGELVDMLDDKGMYDCVNWDVYPYSLVMQDPSLYWESDRFVKMVANEMKKQHESHRPPSIVATSPLSWRQQEDMFHLQENKSLWRWKQMRSFEADLRFARSTSERWCTRLRQLRFYFLYTLAFFAGFPTLGFWWPRRVRALFCAGSTTSDAEEDDDKKPGSAPVDLSLAAEPGFVSRDRYDVLEKKVDEMKETIDSLHRSIEQLVRLQSRPPPEQDWEE